MNMPQNEQTGGPEGDPFSALHTSPNDGVLAIIIGVEGPSYRPLGASMVIFEDGRRVGTLSSGCIEADLALHAEATLARGTPDLIVYGLGSPFIDIKLPCGGGLEILLVPRPDRSVLSMLTEYRDQRAACTLITNCETGAMSVTDVGETGRKGSLFRLRIEPDIFFYVFGKGPEAGTFSAMVQSAGYPNLLLAPDMETLDFGESAGCRTHHLLQAAFPPEYVPDEWSAVVLFFHDHEWEPPILQVALQSRAFYIGAQGSQRARDARHLEIEALFVTPDDLARLRGPIGLIQSARNARTLAVGVLAEVLSVATQR